MAKFSDHGVSVNEFYEEGAYKLCWSQGSKPTAQALELIGILQEADRKGLDSKDYDGKRWLERLEVIVTKLSKSQRSRRFAEQH